MVIELQPISLASKTLLYPNCSLVSRFNKVHVDGNTSVCTRHALHKAYVRPGNLGKRSIKPVLQLPVDVLYFETAALCEVRKVEFQLILVIELFIR